MSDEAKQDCDREALRDRIATTAMGHLMDHVNTSDAVKAQVQKDARQHGMKVVPYIAHTAYVYADEMLYARDTVSAYPGRQPEQDAD